MVTTEDVIIWNDFSEREYDTAIKHAAVYAVLSVPYTIDRMNYGNSPEGLLKRIENIVKGKVGEYLFEAYCQTHDINISRRETETPFWRYDKNDFIIDGTTVDLKNNIIWGGYDIIKEEVVNFPALVPADQFEKPHPSKFMYVFSFMNTKDFFSIELNEATLRHIGTINDGCCGKQLKEKPSYYTNDRQYFLDLFAKFGKQPVVKINSYPHLVIAGMSQDLRGFYKTPAGTMFRYRSGNIKTRKENYTLEVKNLSPFKF